MEGEQDRDYYGSYVTVMVALMTGMLERVCLYHLKVGLVIVV